MWIAGQRVLDRYRLVEHLAEGGGGEAWFAEGPQGPVVIKRIPSEDRRRFRDLMREAQVLRDLEHPHVVRYREFSDRPDEDCAILVTDYVAGGDLEAWVTLVGPRGPREVAALGLQIVSALEALAEEDVLHRDLKPANVLVDEGDEGVALRVADFGISRPLRDGVAATQDRSLTPMYAAPEQHTGGTLTSATDLYALGGVSANIAPGQPPPKGGKPTGGTERGPQQERDHALSPSDRPTLAQTRTALEAIRDARPVELPPTHAPHQTLAPDASTYTPEPVVVRTRPSRRWPAGVALALGLLLAGLGAGQLWRPAEPPVPSAQPPKPVVVTTPAPPPESEPAPEAATRAEAEPPPEPQPDPRPAPIPAPTEAAEPAVLFVNSRPFSTVFLDGVRLGDTGDLGAKFEVAPGEHVLRLESQTGLGWEATVDIRGERRLCVLLATGSVVECSS